MNLDQVEKRSFSLPLRCDYLLYNPPRPAENALLVIALHGHAMTPEQMMKLTALLVGEEHYIACPRGPHQLWVNQQGQPRSGVAFHWATNYEPEHSRRMHHDMILHVLQELGVPAERALLAGFSQSVSLNYRFVCTHIGAVRGAIAFCGGIPGDWESAPYRATTASALHIATREDEYYPPAVTELYPARLRLRIPDVEFHLLDGGHRIPSSARPIVQNWMARVFQRSSG